MSRVLVVAPHPDDEVLGAGGTMARLADEGHEVYVVIVTKGDEDLFSPEVIAQGRREAMAAHRILGVKDTIFWDRFPAAKLDTVPHHQLNAAFAELFKDLNPCVLFIPFYGDIHKDHRLVFESALVAARPVPGISIKEIYAYETLSETNWNAPPITVAFTPNVYVDISGYIDRKLEAMKFFKSQLRDYPHERSLEALRALSQLRGATVGVSNAEAFMLIRWIR